MTDETIAAPAVQPSPQNGSWGAWFERVSATVQTGIKLIASILVILLFLLALLLLFEGVGNPSLVVEEFHTSKQFADQGLGGRVVASKLLDRMNQFQRATNSAQRERTYISNEWDEDIKLSIPQTGTSVGEVRRLLRRWLGRETRISGELLSSPTGTELTVRVIGTTTVVARDPGQNLDSLLEKAALDIFKETQPYRHATYLRAQARNTFKQSRPERMAEALDAAKRLATVGDSRYRPWGMLAWGNMVQAMEGAPAEAIERLEAAASQLPEQPVPRANIADQYLILSDPERALANYRTAVSLLQRGDHVSKRFEESLAASYPASVDALLGNYRAAAAGYEKAAGTAPATASRSPTDSGAASIDKACDAYLSLHDISGARRLRRLHDRRGGDENLAKFGRQLKDYAGKTKAKAKTNANDAPLASYMRTRGDPAGDIVILFTTRALVTARYEQLQEATAAEDWVKVRREIDPAVEESKAAKALLKDVPAMVARIHATIWPAYIAIYAAIGENEKARKLSLLASAEPQGANSYDLKTAMAKLASAGKDWQSADSHFSEAVSQAPSIPRAYFDWGESYARRGDTRRAVELYEKAYRLAPRWADPLKAWGDTFRLKGYHRRAARLYRAAFERAPRWGALHMAWGRSLWSLGDRGQARLRFSQAATMDLTERQRAELDRIRQKIG